MRLFVGVTDGDWFRHLAAIPAIDEVNFWQPSGSSHFRDGNLSEYEEWRRQTLGDAATRQPRMAYRKLTK